MASADAVSQQLTLTCKAEFSEYVRSEENTCWALVSTQAPPYVEDEKSRAPLDLVAVVDKSGSMQGDKIKMVRETLKFVVNQMSPNDRFGLVLYDSSVYKIGDGLVRMDDKGKAKMLDEIERIKTGSCTNLSGGLVSGLEMIERIRSSSAQKNEVASLLLMTDGEANEGYTSTADIVKCLTPQGRASLGYAGARTQRLRQRPARNMQQAPASSSSSGFFGRVFGSFMSSASPPQAQQNVAPPPPQAQQNVALPPLQAQQIGSSGSDTDTDEEASAKPETPPKVDGNLAATVYTFGFGAQHNADLLQAVSEAGNGMYYFIDSAEKIPESFADCLGGLLSTVAQNISMEIKSATGVSVVSAFSGREKKSSASGATCTLPLGDIQSEEKRDILVKLSLPKLDEENMQWHVLDARLSYFNVITSSLETKEAQLVVSRPSTKRSDLESDEDVDTHKNRIMAAEAMQQAMAAAEQGDMMQAQSILRVTSDQIMSSKSASNAICTDMMDDITEVQQQMTSTAWGSGGKHNLRGKMQKHMVQRSNVSSDNAYTTSARKMKKAAF